MHLSFIFCIVYKVYDMLIAIDIIINMTSNISILGEPAVTLPNFKELDSYFFDNYTVYIIMTKLVIKQLGVPGHMCLFWTIAIHTFLHHKLSLAEY